MTFEEWWYTKGNNYGQEWNRKNIEHAWNAATAAERQRCREIVKALCGTVVGEMTVKRIVEEIGE